MKSTTVGVSTVVLVITWSMHIDREPHGEHGLGQALVGGTGRLGLPE